jgi:hypothetical protein
MISIQYNMIEFNDSDGRLLVVLRVERKTYCVFVDGKRVATLPSGREALDYARSLASQDQGESPQSPSTIDNKDAE